MAQARQEANQRRLRFSCDIGHREGFGERPDTAQIFHLHEEFAQFPGSIAIAEKPENKGIASSKERKQEQQ